MKLRTFGNNFCCEPFPESVAATPKGAATTPNGGFISSAKGTTVALKVLAHGTSQGDKEAFFWGKLTHVLLDGEHAKALWATKKYMATIDGKETKFILVPHQYVLMLGYESEQPTGYDPRCKDPKSTGEAS